MFNFMKKGAGFPEKDKEKNDRDEKERRKLEKKLRKEQGIAGTMSTEELLRLEEVRRSLKIRGRRKEKEKLPSGITADYSAEFFAKLDFDRGIEMDRGNDEVVTTVTSKIDGNGFIGQTHEAIKPELMQTTASSNSASTLAATRTAPHVPPKPPKRGILKGARPTPMNEETISVCSLEGPTNSTLGHNIAQTESISNKTINSIHINTSSSPSVDSLSDTTNSSFATPPFSLSPIGESQGIYAWSRVHSFDDKNLELPPIKLDKLPAPRELNIERQKTARNDFGFSLRKALCLDRYSSMISPKMKTVIFAEPGALSYGTGLLPGDRLLKVNGTSVEDLPRETIVEMIKNCGDSVTVEVQPVAELVELSRRCVAQADESLNDSKPLENDRDYNTLRRSASKRLKYAPNSKSEHASENLEALETVWLVHRGGFCEAFRLPVDGGSTNGKALIKVKQNGIKLTVDEDDIEKCNPSNLDLAEDICQLKHLNEASVLHCLRQRFANNLIHTRAGPTLIIVNPMAPLSLYSEKVVSMFRGCKSEDMPPHIYSTTQTAYRSMLESRRDQSLIFLGRSGSGKTTSFKHALFYLVLAAGSVNSLLTAEKLNAINTILETFGNTKTQINPNSTRFSQLWNLDFDSTGQIASASIEIFLLEQSRAGRRTAKDNYFHVLPRLIAGAEGNLQKELHLDNIKIGDENLFVTLPSKIEERQRFSTEFMRVNQAFSTLNIDETCVKSIWTVLASIYHLGFAGSRQNENIQSSRTQFANPIAAQLAASLLGISMDDLASVAFPSNSNGTTSETLDVTGNDRKVENSLDNIEALAIGLYSEMVATVVALINKEITKSVHTVASILLLDTPGFQNPASCGHQQGASLSDLQHNYLQERLQLLYHHMNLVAPKDRYEQELIEINIDISENNSGPLVSLIDRVPKHHVMRPSQQALNDQDRRGLFLLLDEESIYPNSNDDTFLERFLSHCGDRESQVLVRHVVGNRQFILQHLLGTNPVLYSTTGWLKKSKEHVATKSVFALLQGSSKPDISKLLLRSLGRNAGVSLYCGAGMDNCQSLRRTASIRRSFNTAGGRRNATMLQVKLTVDGIIDIIRRTGIHFVHCLILQHYAGTSSIVINSNQPKSADDFVNIPLLRSQLRGSQILEAARLHRLGFPESIPITEFMRLFSLLHEDPTPTLTPEQILSASDIDPSAYRIGKSLILFRTGILVQLEAQRDELLADRIIQLQAHCRGQLSRRRVKKRRILELAVRCIQRNVRAFLKVRDWPWWRLLIRVAPLLNVHRTEEQLKLALTEMQALKMRTEKTESERLLLKSENEMLKTKLSEINIELTEERSASNLTNERLEAETSDRLRLENQMQYHLEKMKNLQESSENLEIELMCAKSDFNGLSEDEELEQPGENSISFYKIKFERASRELEFTKRRLQSQHEYDLEQLVGLKKQLEKKIADAYEEVEEQRQVVAQWKKKNQKICNEMNDLRMLLEEQNGRNNLLEKKQRKFDSECQSLQTSLRQEKQTKERLSREQDVLIAEKFTLEQNLGDKQMEIDIKDEKINILTRELEEIAHGSGSEQELSQLRRSKVELEKKCQEQEEELDDMAGQLQLLEQTKLRLEMSLETTRKEGRREAQQRDDELEEVRGNCFKKIKGLECQLESEHEERTLLVREKHELIRRLRLIEEQNQTDRIADETIVQKLRRDLRKYKALLKDTQSQLDRVKADTPNKILIRQLRNQIEDSEAARVVTAKARQAVELELTETQAMLEEANRTRHDAEERAVAAGRDLSELQILLEENEDEMAQVLKKYSTTVKQLNSEQGALSQSEMQITELQLENQSLRDQITELQTRIDNAENLNDPTNNYTTRRLELRTKELESRMELEVVSRSRFEVQCNRQKEGLLKAQTEINSLKAKEAQAQESHKKAQKNLRDLRDEYNAISNREQESLLKRKDLEKHLETSGSELSSLRNDLRLALQRIDDLQHAMEDGDTDSSISDAENNSSDGSFSESEPKTARLQTISVPKKSGSETSVCDSDTKIPNI